MNITIPFQKEILFKSKIAEITSISLEHDVSINDNELLGDFIVSGEYKNLDVNVDVLPFNHVVPFRVSLEDNIDINTLDYSIVDFSYDVKNDDTLFVKIDFNVTANKLVDLKEELFIKPEDDEISKNIIEENRNDNVFIEVNKDEIKESEVDNTLLNEVNDKRDNDAINNENINAILNNNMEKDYITYHVHMVKINESVESICTQYNIDKELIMELNDISEVSMGDKILIPLNSNE